MIEIVKRLVGLDKILAWMGDKLINEYGVTDMLVTRSNDSVVIIIKGDKDKLGIIENELRGTIGKMFGKKIFVEVKKNG